MDRQWKCKKYEDVVEFGMRTKRLGVLILTMFWFLMEN